MNKFDTTIFIKDKHEGLINYLRSLDEQTYLFAQHGKWSAAEQLDHLLKSVSPVNLALSLPKFVLKWMFGKSNRPSRSYEELVEKYQGKLLAGGKAPKAFTPKKIPFAQRELSFNKLEKLALSVSRKANRYSEDELNTFILPHPLLGKLTLREMLYFTGYHCIHHHKLIDVAIANNEQNNL